MRTRKISVEELMDELELQQWEFCCQGFLIIEDLLVRREFVVEDLHIEIEDDMIFFFDKAYTLINSVLAVVLKEAILSIQHRFKDGLMSDDITFKTGHVYINAIAS